MGEIKVLPREENESGDKSIETPEKKFEKKSTIEVPSYRTAIFRMLDGSWLSVNDDEETDANKQFVGGNLNLLLICALLFTTYLPLYYSEASRLNDETDGLTIDIMNGYLSPLVISKDFLHDVFDISYLVACAGTLFGTMVSVFFMLAANEANDDARTFVLMRSLGPVMTQLPYFYFTLGIWGWAFGGFFHIFLVPRLASGFYVKVILTFLLASFPFVLCIPRMIRGIFLGKVESQKHPPIFVSEEKIEMALNTFFSNPDSDGDFSLQEFLRSLTYITDNGYRPKLQSLTQVRATCKYYEKVAALTGNSISEVKEALT